MFSLPSFGLPQEVIDQMLALGGNDRNSRYHIVARFRKDFPTEDNAAFLAREFKTGGRGFMLDGQQYAVWWDAEGIRVARGATARTEDALFIPYDRAAARIRELLDAGRYMSEDELGFVDQVEIRELAERIVHAYWDDLPNAQRLWDHGGFPDEQAQVEKLLSDPISRDRLILRLEADIGNPASYSQERRRWHNLSRLREDARALQRVPLAFSSQFPIPAPTQVFITGDEIDAFFRHGGSYEGSRESIYRYFTEAHSTDERAEFLKKAYGIGGRSHALSGADDSWADYDGKGIVLKRGSISNPSATVKLNWRQAAKRVTELIGSGRYLTAEEAERLAARHVEEATPIADTSDDEAYDLSYDRTADGVDVNNHPVNETNEPETIAHISESGEVIFHDETIPQSVRDAIHHHAEEQRQHDATLPTEKIWIDDMLGQNRDDILRRVTESPRFRLALRSGDAENFRLEVDSIIEEVASGFADDNIDLCRAYYDYPEFREGVHAFILEQASRQYHRPEAERQTGGPEQAIPAVEKAARPQLETDDSPEVQRAMAEYNRQKEALPDSIVLVQVGTHYETYGEDALRVRAALDSREWTRSAPGGAPVTMSGFDPASQWVYYLKQLCDQGNSVLLRGLSESNEYETVKDVKAADYIPVGAELKIDGHDFRVDTVNFQSRTVSLQDLTMFASGYPLFRNEPIAYVRELLEEQNYFFKRPLGTSV